MLLLKNLGISTSGRVKLTENLFQAVQNCVFNRDESGGLKNLSTPVEFKPGSEADIVKEAPEDTIGENEEVQVHATVSFVSLGITYLFCKICISAIATCTRSRFTKR